MVEASRAAMSFPGSRPTCRRQHGQPPSGASDGISAPHCGQTLGALIIAGESLTRSLSFLLRKMLSEVTPGLQQLNGAARLRSRERCERSLGRGRRTAPLSRTREHCQQKTHSDVVVINGRACRGGNTTGCQAKVVPLRMGGFTLALTVDESSGTVYVSNNEDGTVSLFSARGPLAGR